MQTSQSRVKTVPFFALVTYRPIPSPISQEVATLMKSIALVLRYSTIPLAVTGCLWTFMSISASVVYAQGKSTLPPRVEIPGTQVLTLSSSNVPGQEYALQIALPRGYSDTTRTFPVAYILDGQWDFALVQALYGEQFYDGFVPDVILVGITWGGTNPNVDSLRARDFTPTHNDQLPQSGGASRFLAFIKGELIPFVEARFRASRNDRILMGSSFGGLFTLYAMFHETELFHRYIAPSPALGWNGDALFADEKAFAASTSQLPAKLYMTIGEYEDVPRFERFVGQLKSRTYAGLDLQTRVLENTGHSGSKAEGYTRGLQHVFARPSLNIDATVLNQYRGTYQVDPHMRVTFFVDQGRLMGKAPDGPAVVLHAESEKDFYVKGQYMFLHFKKNEAGTVSGFQMELFGGTQFVKKVE
jgi:predicted alpha/beta superfamily hydrolase